MDNGRLRALWCICAACVTAVAYVADALIPHNQ